MRAGTSRVRGAVRGWLPGIGVGVGIPALVCWAWLQRGLQWDVLPDGLIHLVRSYFMADALGRGDLYPRWFPDLYFGYGYPLFTFYAPALYYVTGALHLLGATVYDSLRWVGVASVASGALGAFALGAELGGLAGHYSAGAPSAREWERGTATPVRRRWDSGVLAAVAYALAPYPFVTNLYVRGAMPEALALGVLPWLLFAVWRGRAGARRWLVVVAVLLAALVLTHNISALLAAGLCALWGPVVAWISGGKGKRTLAALGVAAAAGVGLSAFFWLPAILEIRQTQYDQLREELFQWDVRLFDPLGRAGAVTTPEYPHTRVGPVDLSLAFDYRAPNLTVPEKVSLGQGLLLLCAVVGTAAATLGKRLTWRVTGWLPGSLLAVVAVCVWLNTTWSWWMWEHGPLLSYAQFPWRLYGPLSLCLALAAAVVFSTWLSQDSLLGRALIRVTALGLALVLAWGSLAKVPAVFGAEPAHDIDARTQEDFERNTYGAGTTTGGEYLPQTVSIAQYESFRRRGIKVYDEAYPQVGWQAGLVRLLSGDGAVTDVGAGRTWVVARVEGRQPVTLAVHQLWFPGWRAFIDGAEVPLETVEYNEAHQASLGFMAVRVPEGAHQVEVRLGPTALGRVGVFVTWLTLGAGGAWSFGVRRRWMPVAGLLAGCVAVGAQAWLAAPHAIRAGAPVAGSRVPVDFAERVRAGGVQVTSIAGTGRGWMSPYVEERWLAIGGERRRWLFAHAPAEISAVVRVPPGAYFQSGLGLDPEVWDADAGDGVRFILEAQRAGGGAREVVWSRDVVPRARGEDRAWIDVWVSLQAYAGQEVTLTLRTDPRADQVFDWAGWANPQVVAWDSPRLSPAIPHRW